MPKLTVFKSGYWFIIPDRSDNQKKEAGDRLKYYTFQRRMASLGYNEYIELQKETRKNYTPLGWSTKSKAIFLSRGIELNKTKKNRLKTFVLTYPESYKVNESGKDLNRFFTNAKKTWNLEKYLWTLELQKNGQFHFHVIADMPKIKKKQIWKFNRTWEKARQTPAHQNKGNGLTGFQTVKHQDKLLLYISKYVSKSQNSFKSEKALQFLKDARDKKQIKRVFNTSRELNGNESCIFHSDIDQNLYENLKNNINGKCNMDSK